MLQLSERTLGDWLEHWAAETPDKEYIVYSDRNLRFTWGQFNRRVDNMAKGLLAIGVKHGTHVGIWAKKCTRLADFPVCLCQNRRRGRYSEYQLQTGGTGIPVRELGHAYALHRGWRTGQQLCGNDLQDASGAEDFRTWTSEKQTFPLHAERHLHRAGEIPGNV